MSYASDSDHIKTGVRSAWFTVLFAATIGGLLLLFSDINHRSYDYRLDLMPIGLLLVAAIFTPVMIAAHGSSLLGYRELSRRQCRIAKASIVTVVVVLWLTSGVLDVAALI
jgi:FtsH-binding integral membrane protein